MYDKEIRKVMILLQKDLSFRKICLAGIGEALGKCHIPSLKAISFPQTCNSKTVKQHKNDLVLTKVSFQNIVLHCFGDDEECDKNWCSGKFDARYNHKPLSYGRDLWEKEIKKDLNQVFEKHAKI